MNYRDVREFFSARAAIVPKDDYEKVFSVLDAMSAREAPEMREKADVLKNTGNEAYAKGDYTEALALYTKAIEIDPLYAVLYSNRAIVYSKLGMDKEGIEDCLAGIRLDSGFIKFYIRIGLFHMATDRARAHEYFQEGLKRDPKNEYLQKLAAETAPDKSAAESTGMKSRLMSLMNNKELQDKVKDFMKNKSPSEVASMVQNTIGKFK